MHSEGKYQDQHTHNVWSALTKWVTGFFAFCEIKCPSFTLQHVKMPGKVQCHVHTVVSPVGTSVQNILVSPMGTQIHTKYGYTFNSHTYTVDVESGDSSRF